MTRESPVSGARVTPLAPADRAAPTPEGGPAGPAPEGDPAGPAPARAPDLAARQAALVAALVAGGPVPDGLDPQLIAIVRRALLRKRAGAAAAAWPLLAASLGDGWLPAFTAHHDGAPSAGALRDGWDLALALRRRGELSPGARGELAAREAALRYDGRRDPRPRRGRRIRRAVAYLRGRGQ